MRCFEEIADLSDPDYLDRIQPLTRFNWPLRNRRITSVFDCRNFCCGGVERLVDEWKARRGKWIDEQDGVKEEKKSPAWENLMERAGSSTFTFQMIPGLTSDAQLLLGHSLAPFESDGEGDTTEWNLFDSYLDAQDDEESHYEKHNLSSILQRWKHDEVSVDPILSIVQRIPSCLSLLSLFAKILADSSETCRERRPQPHRHGKTG